MDQNIQNIDLISNSRTALAYLNFSIIYEFLDNFLYDTCIIFHKGADNFQIDHKTC